MIKIKVIKTEEDYKEALGMLEALIRLDPEPDSEEGEQLNLLSTLIEDYESKAFPETLPDPIEAIKFRMEQVDLKPADLIPYIGSRSRVSEILSGKRQLTLEMVRALEVGLGIPAKVLIKKPGQENDLQYQSWDNRLVSEMESRGYFGSASLKKTSKVGLLDGFFDKIWPSMQAAGAFLRKTNYRASPLTDRNALIAWSTHVFKQAKKIKAPKYKHGTIDTNFLQSLVRLSIKDNGPILAQDYLLKYGIILIIEPHFPKTYLDGATILIDNDHPVIGLTLRHNRLDNFWFTLMHELAHVALHYGQEVDCFYDELEGVKGAEVNGKEQEADKLARESLVPDSKWEVSPAKLIPSPMAAQSLANELGIHVAIAAGVMRHEHNNYFYLNKIVNDFKVRSLFKNIKWNK